MADALQPVQLILQAKRNLRAGTKPITLNAHAACLIAHKKHITLRTQYGYRLT